MKIGVATGFTPSDNSTPFPNKEVPGMVRTIPFSPASPTIDATQTRWAAEQLAELIRHVGTDSVTGLILRQAQHELQSLTPRTGEAAEVVGPVRLRVVA
jgi:hypothetical protein